MNHTAPTLLADVAAAMHGACLRDLPDHEYPWRKPGTTDEPTIKTRRPEIYDLRDVVVFQQTWGSTALGFGGIGGAAMTSANVVVVTGPGGHRSVYFGGRLAYLIRRPNRQFFEDVSKHSMADVAGASKRYEETAKA